MPEVIRTSNFVEDAVKLIVEQAREAIAARGLFRLSLCGGSTPKPVYTRLAQTTGEFDWRNVQITFGDERCVPPDDAQSNYRMARETLLDQIPILPENVFRMRGELDPEKAPAEYEAKLAETAARFKEPRYRHDLLLLGMGDDGHTASLFPGTKALSETERDVVANDVPKLSASRITFTFPLINSARHVCFLVNDPKKNGIVEAVMAGGSGYPAEQVKPESGKLTWLLGA
jgi:6-phosphogluconolactonase